jgi:hypothetical protein
MVRNAQRRDLSNLFVYERHFVEAGGQALS